MYSGKRYHRIDLVLRLQKEQKVDDGPATELRHRVFIYGTLKRGQPNHHLMNMQELGRCRLIGGARTDVSFPLIITTRWNLPFLLYAPGHGQVLISAICLLSSVV